MRNCSAHEIPEDPRSSRGDYTPNYLPCGITGVAVVGQFEKGGEKLINFDKYGKIYPNVHRPVRGIHVTVCITAICLDSMIVCASDRMLTADDVEFEPQKSKIIPLSNSIVAMIAGESALQDEIIQKIYLDIGNRIKSDPQNWWKVSDVADLYFRYYNEKKRKIAESRFLAPLGLDSDSFISRQQQMNNQVATQLTNEIISFHMPDVEVIFSGIDSTGAHIYKFVNERSLCLDRVGFASIGIGARHADSEFMFSGHIGSRGLPETLLLVYSAKKRADGNGKLNS
jgi:hypothetical protein